MGNRALDLFCGAGGASRGLADAGYEVTGVDINPQPNYPFAFMQADAMTFPLKGFDLIWASPPCQRYMTGGVVKRADAPDLIAKVRNRLWSTGTQWIIENVPGAPLRKDVVLCGSHFGLALRRHRIFEMSFTPAPQLVCKHKKPIAGVYGNLHGSRGAWPGMLPSTLAVWSEAMGIDWMTAHELTQAIPPAYSKYLVERL